MAVWLITLALSVSIVKLKLLTGLKERREKEKKKNPIPHEPGY